jgi:excisionase family DNA binding protein
MEKIFIMTALAYPNRQSAPTAQEANLARVSGQCLSRYSRRKKPLSLRVMEVGREQPIELPARAVALLMDILEAMAAGRGVTIVPENAELTTVQAAALLNVSRPFLIKLLEEKAIPHRLVGKHRRVLIDDVMAYKAQIDRAREVILERLTAEAQNDDMGYARS